MWFLIVIFSYSLGGCNLINNAEKISKHGSVGYSLLDKEAWQRMVTEVSRGALPEELDSIPALSRVGSRLHLHSAVTNIHFIYTPKRAQEASIRVLSVQGG